MRGLSWTQQPIVIGLAVGFLLNTTSVLADTALTKGGLQIKSEDGKFEAKLGGRINLDAIYFIDEDDLPTADNNNSTASFRRARLTLEGKAHDWQYKIENDFAGQTGTTGSGFRDVWIGRSILGHEVKFGQTKVFRGLEELGGSNHQVFQEFPTIGAGGLFRARQIGVFAEKDFKGGGYGVSVFNTREAGSAASQGLGYNARGFISPINADGKLLHLGVTGTVENNPVVNDPAANITAGGRSTSNDWRVRPRVVGVNSGLRPTLVGDSEAQKSITVEAAGLIGSLYAQAELARTTHDRVSATGASVPSEDVDAFYVQGSYILTGESKRYNAKKGLFLSPNVKDSGVIELKARFEQTKNRDTNAEATQYIVGANYYFNPNTRALLEYVDGSFQPAGSAPEQNASAVQARLQFHF